MSSPPDGTFQNRLRAKIRETGNSLCVGIDPPLDGLPEFFRKDLAERGPEAYLRDYSTALVDAAAGAAPAVKFQSAYFEAHGAPGFSALTQGLAYARRRGLITLLDAKRGDIAQTMAAYGTMAFKVMDADALTVAPYMGLDVLEPLVPWLKAGRGVYVVWISSNPSGALVQEAEMRCGHTLAEDLLTAIQDFAAQRQIGVGLVLGATKVEQLSEATWAQLHDTPLLMPGVGAQGGSVTPRIGEMIERSGSVLVPLSRGVGEFPVGCSSWQDYKKSVSTRLSQSANELRG